MPSTGTRAACATCVPANLVRVTVASALGSMAWQRVGLGAADQHRDGFPMN
jgi:hypothetical protein